MYGKQLRKELHSVLMPDLNDIGIDGVNKISRLDQLEALLDELEEQTTEEASRTISQCEYQVKNLQSSLLDFDDAANWESFFSYQERIAKAHRGYVATRSKCLTILANARQETSLIKQFLDEQREWIIQLQAAAEASVVESPFHLTLPISIEWSTDSNKNVTLPLEIQCYIEP